jgi:DNA-binding transcriptional ArsR family regulator
VLVSAPPTAKATNRASSTAALAALGDPTRRAIVERLRGGETAVGQIAAGLPVSRPAVSKHLRVLEASRLVTHVRRGNRSLYRIDTAGFQAVREYLDAFWTDALDAFAAHADALTNPSPVPSPAPSGVDDDDDTSS